MTIYHGMNMFRKYADSQSSHFTRRLAIRLSTILFDAYDVVIELWGSKDEELISSLKSIEKVHSVSLMAHDGEVTF